MHFWCKHAMYSQDQFNGYRALTLRVPSMALTGFKAKWLYSNNTTFLTKTLQDFYTGWMLNV